MAYGVLTNAALLSMGIAPAQASALVHTAEIFTTGASAASHVYHRNVDWRFVLRLGVAGVLGAILGAWILSNIDTGSARALCLYLSAADGRLHPVALGADRADPRAAGRLDAARGLLRRIPGRQRRRRLGTSVDLDAGRLRPRAAANGGIGQHRGVFRHRCIGDDVLGRTRRLAGQSSAATGSRRIAGGAGRRLGGAADFRARADVRGRAR